MGAGMTALRSLVLANNLLETLPARNLTALVRLDMEFKALTDLQPLSAVWPAWGKPPPDIIAQASLRFHASRALPGACSA